MNGLSASRSHVMFDDVLTPPAGNSNLLVLLVMSYMANGYTHNV